MILLLLFLNAVKTIVYHHTMPDILRLVGKNLLDEKNYVASVIVHEEILSYWPNHSLSLFRNGLSLMQLNQFQPALNLANHLKKVAPPNWVRLRILEILLHEKMGNLDQARTAFIEMIEQPEEYLMLESPNYRFLHQKSLDLNFPELTQNLYKKSIKYHGYNCTVENNMAFYYLHSSHPKRAIPHIKKVLKHNPKCILPWILKRLKELKIKI